MSDDSKDAKTGYGHPPRHSQFRPGESGNPGGRPKARRSIRSDLEEELAASTTVKDGNTSLSVSKQRAIVKALVKAATEGNMRAVTALLNFCAKVPDESDDDERTPEETEILEAYRQKNRSTSSEHI